MNDLIGMINLWQLNRLPKGFTFKYVAQRNIEKQYFNSLNEMIKFASCS